MVVSEGAINNIMGGMENTAGVRLHSHRHKLKQRFDIIRKLGQGTYGKVQLAVNKETGQEVAIKTIKKAKIETEQDLIRIRREIQIMSSVQHPQIIHIYEVFENREKMVLVMEYAAGGELYDYLSERKVLNEDEARRVFRHVASATYYCHKHKICHRDLKLENILLDMDGNAKIADFGLSNVFDDKHRLDTFCGSPLYASPEIVKGVPYTGPEVDCWSLGVLLYTLVYGAMPFDGSNFKRLVKQITQGDYYEPKKPSSASDLIRQMLTVSATKRATIEDICTHWWVNEGYLESCLDVAEALANQTPVRLDLLLSLAPKHINSEHMLIQPEEDDSMRSPPTSEATRPPPQLHLPPPPPEALPVIPTRSVSLGAISSMNHNEIEALLTKKLKDKKKEDEKKRKADQSGVIEKKKKKDSTVEGTPKPSRKERKADVNSHEGDTSSIRRPPVGPEGESLERKKSTTKKKEQVIDGESSERDRSDRSERKKSVKKREPVADGDISDISDKSERRKSVKKREPSVDKDISESEKLERKKSVKKRDSSLTRQPNDDKVERRKSTKKKEPLKEDNSVSANSESVTEPVINGEKLSDLEMGKSKDAPIGTSEDQLPGLSLKPPLPKDQVLGRSSSSDVKMRKSSSSGKTDLGKAYQNEQLEPMETEQLPLNSSPLSTGSSTKLSGSAKSVGSSASNEGTLKASDSSLSRESVSPMKIDSGTVTQAQVVKTKSPSPSHVSQVKKVKSKSLVKTSSKNKVEDKPSAVPVMNGEASSPVSVSVATVDETEKILQETADKIKHVEESNIPVIIKTEDSQGKEALSEDIMKKESEMTGDQRRKEFDSAPDSSKEASQSSSLLSTPTRSRAGSESSNEAKPTRTDSTKRQSKIFKAAAMWENQGSQQPPTPPAEKAKKPVRPGGNAMSDLAKKFEEKQTAGKPKLVPSLKGPVDSHNIQEADRKKSQVEIVLNNKNPAAQEPDLANKRASYAEIQLTSPTAKEAPKPQEFKSEVRHSVESPRGMGEAQLQRAKRERIIPIMMEDEEDDDDRTTSEGLPRSERPITTSSSMGSRVIPQPLPLHSRASEPRSPIYRASPETIMKSRRERIIPIAVEGEGIVTPPPHVEEAAELGAARAHQAFTRTLAGRPNPLNRGRGFHLDHSESFSSAGEEEEEDEDDGFQILTAESLFSTLLNRVRSLTRKMNADEIRSGERARGPSHHPTPEPNATPSTAGVGAAHSSSSGFWSSLYNSPRDSPARRISETMSRSSLGREDETLGGLNSPMWTRSVSRDTSDADTLFSEASTPFSTLPRVRTLRHSLHLPPPRLFPDSFFLSDFT